MKEDGTLRESDYAGTESVSICFEELSKIKDPLCIYFDESKS